MSRNNNNRDNEWNWWKVGAAVASGAAVVGGLAYMLNRGAAVETPQRLNPSTEDESEEELEPRGFMSTLRDSLSTIIPNDLDCEVVPEAHVPSRPVIPNLNALLADIHVRYIAIKREEFQIYYRVFTTVFRKLHDNMKAVDKYYARYSSNVQFAGSHSDNLHIDKPDEFDMDIVIGMPVNMHEDPYNPEESDIVIEKKYPGFVQLRAGTQYKNIIFRDGPDCIINRTAHSWLDSKDYILRSKFTDWFKSVGNRALNQFRVQGCRPVHNVDGIDYTIRTSSSGPAWTIIIEASGFKLDVNLVPAVKFPEDRWLDGKSYREIPDYCRRDYWMVVPKPNKSGETIQDEERSWRIALQDQERKLLHDTGHLRQVIRLLKKLRDVQGMKKIASYYIKTIFFWEIVEKKNTDPLFWHKNNIATLFEYMLRKLYDALDKKNIPYFWNKNKNMIENVDPEILKQYKDKILSLQLILQVPSEYKSVAKYLLTSEEYEQYKQFL